MTLTSEGGGSGPVAAGVTSDPRWMAGFAGHLEACGFESIVVVEHTVLVTRYDSVYPYDRSAKWNCRPTARCPTRLTCLLFWPATLSDSHWPPGCWCCRIITLWYWRSGLRPSTRCPAGGCGCASAWAGSKKNWTRAESHSTAVAGALTNSWRSCVRCGTTAPTNQPPWRVLPLRRCPVLPKPVAGTSSDPHRRTQPRGGATGGWGG